eukprot:9469014-Alexandrium_andersonii.AAC.1
MPGGANTTAKRRTERELLESLLSEFRTLRSEVDDLRNEVHTSRSTRGRSGSVSVASSGRTSRADSAEPSQDRQA